MLEQCCYYSKQCCNNVAKLCWAKNRRCESSRAPISCNIALNPSLSFFTFLLPSPSKFPDQSALLCDWLTCLSSRSIPILLCPFLYEWTHFCMFELDCGLDYHPPKISSRGLPDRAALVTSFPGDWSTLGHQVWWYQTKWNINFHAIGEIENKQALHNSKWKKKLIFKMPW